jgi:K+-transporting ATPase ATPase C chain
MKTFFSSLKSALLLTLVFALVLCVAYPLAVWAGGQLFFADKANGSLIVDADGTVRGSELLGQPFNSNRYFQSRPSAAGGGYDAGVSSGTNLGPTSQKLADAVKANVEAYRAANNLSADASVPADAVTASSSGLDPHISIANANLQAARVAQIRGFSLEKVQSLISAHTVARDFGVLGESGVNVVLLNRALDLKK